ncbi:hypothetical protein O6H91_23G000400 [Diphasiastrum complanatum]|uniref:Uncharacterized protein n=3 Tax=Diphasiastrum complanatum TaxID=34168 RepID=A0ACC2A7C7_DIPCM|nr:hypothetical protein O6H91_Y000400 [Diphasiastrum complanatum]KAJ7513458.1 hypothetical protein O6H91_23G000400 [Diphasiastrum complanatum]
MRDDVIAGIRMEESCGPSTVVVGLKLSPQSRELLTWIVAKLTQPGDHVIGVHVLRSEADAEFSDSELDPSIRQQLDNTFEAMLGVYQGLCTLKQIQLDIKVVTGTTVRDGLVEVSKMENATKLILGSSGHHAVRWRNSLAKYCMKNLPRYCAVLVVERGKITFEKQGMHAPGHEKLSAGIWDSLMRFRHQKAQIIMPSDKKDTDSSLNLEESSSSGDFVPYDNYIVENSSYLKSCSDEVSPDSPVSVLHSDMNEEGLQESTLQNKECLTHLRTRSEGGDNAQVDYSDLTVRCTKVDSSIHGDGNRSKGSSSQPGWPLMHRTMSLEKMASSFTSARRISVVKWALELPERPTVSIKVSLEDKGNEELGLISLQHDFQGKYFEGTMEGVANEQESHCSNHSVCGDPQIKSPVGMEDTTNQTMSLLNVEDARVSSNETKGLPQRALTLENELDLLIKRRSCSRYTYEELEIATCNFCPDNLVGKGGSSIVYQGVLQNGQRIAVKCFNERSPDAEQELLTEVEILLTLRHRHIVALLGYYVDSQRHLLVYNLASKGNLDENLHGGLETPTLDWRQRYKIAVGAAQALEYLHDGCPQPVVHRDVKSSNILLSAGFEAQISDFGLAKWAPTSSTHITCTDVVGTFGYLAPEYFMFGKVNEKTDVYSFGVVLLELITGRRPIDVSRPKGQENLVLWSKPLLEGGKGEVLIDPKLKQSYDRSQMQHMILAASLCINESPKSRPGMRQVLRFLCGEHDDNVSHLTRDLFVFKDKDDECPTEECLGNHDVRSHLALALLGVDNDSVSLSSADPSCLDRTHSIKNLEEYLRNRFSRSSSFE